MSYETETRAAYRNASRATRYHRDQRQALTWGRVVTWRQQRRVRAELQRHEWSPDDRLLDVPCGSGVLGPSLAGVAARVTAGDISSEMMTLARGEYPASRFAGFAQLDITAMPFADGAFRCGVVLGFMHRVPAEIRLAALDELHRVVSEWIVVSYSVNDAWQHLKRRLLRLLRPGYLPAPNPVRRADIEHELAAAGFVVRQAFPTLPLLSAEMVFVAERHGGAERSGS